MRLPLLLARQLIPCLFLVFALSARADRVKVAFIDNEPVFHWTVFTSFVSDDIDRALILRAFRQQRLHISPHLIDEGMQRTANQNYGGDQAKLEADLKSSGETIARFRQFAEEEIILEAMLTKETKLPQNGHPPPTRAAWLATLRKGTKIRQIKPGISEDNEAKDAGNFDDVKADLLVWHKPEYPYAARRDFLQGKGLYLVRFDLKTGWATEASIARSSGHAILDQSALQAMRQWRIKPHTYAKIKVPINFILSGDEAALLRAIGPNLLYAVPPRYPLAASAHGVAGNGRFQLIINPSTGLVTEVQTLQTTHDQRLDAAAVKAFRQWRFRPHTLQRLVVPADFNIRYG
jgi:TonB family protein